VLHLTLVRHASTTLNEQRRYQGWCDHPLSDRGRAEAADLARRLAGERWDRVLSSDLARARDTAALLAPGAEVVPDPRLRELDFGAWDGLTYDEAEARDPEAIRRWIDDPLGVRPPGGESFTDFRARVVAALHDLPLEGSALVVAHGGPVRLLVAELLGLAWSQVVLMQVSACSLTRLAVHPDGAHLLCLNCRV
jgi:alpha-ribazole phosphatase